MLDFRYLSNFPWPLILAIGAFYLLYHIAKKPGNTTPVDNDQIRRWMVIGAFAIIAVVVIYMALHALPLNKAIDNPPPVSNTSSGPPAPDSASAPAKRKDKRKQKAPKEKPDNSPTAEILFYGTVLLPDGHPAEGAQIYLEGLLVAKTDGSGKFRIYMPTEGAMPNFTTLEVEMTNRRPLSVMLSTQIPNNPLLIEFPNETGYLMKRAFIITQT